MGRGLHISCFRVLLLNRLALIKGDLNARYQPNAFQMGGDFERTEPNLTHFKWGSRVNRHSAYFIFNSGRINNFYPGRNTM